MKLVLNYCFLLFLFFLLTGFVSSFAHISYDALESHGTTGRALLQQKKQCTEDFEHKNYTILTSQCKGPSYPPDVCCNAFKQFACPYAEAINDLNSDCAATMFSYINLYGRYPPGLFANMCKEGKDGLECQVAKSSGHIAYGPSTLLMLSAAFLLLPFQLF